MDISGTIKRVKIETFTQLDAAERLIDSSIQLCISNKDYLSAITLAGAAETILGEALASIGKESATSLMKPLLQKHVLPELSHKQISDEHLNKLRNDLKHFCGNLSTSLEYATNMEAFNMIFRAILNFGLVTERPTTKSIDFFAWAKENFPEAFDEYKQFDHENLIQVGPEKPHEL